MEKVAEGATIVLSILLAFGLQAWWEEGKERQEEQQILSALHDEAASNQRIIAQEVARYSDVRSATVTAMSEGARMESTIGADSFDQLIGDASWWGGSTPFEMASLDAVISGGKLSLIRSEELRRKLAAWRREVASYQQLAEQDYDFFLTIWMPFLNEHGNQAQIANAIQRFPGTGAPYTARAPQTPVQTDHRSLLESRQFQNILLRKMWVQDDVLLELGRLDASVQGMLEALAQEMGR